MAKWMRLNRSMSKTGTQEASRVSLLLSVQPEGEEDDKEREVEGRGETEQHGKDLFSVIFTDKIHVLPFSSSSSLSLLLVVVLVVVIDDDEGFLLCFFFCFQVQSTTHFLL